MTAAAPAGRQQAPLVYIFGKDYNTILGYVSVFIPANEPDCRSAGLFCEVYT